MGIDTTGYNRVVFKPTALSQILSGRANLQQILATQRPAVTITPLSGLEFNPLAADYSTSAAVADALASVKFAGAETASALMTYGPLAWITIIPTYNDERALGLSPLAALVASAAGLAGGFFGTIGGGLLVAW